MSSPTYYDDGNFATALQNGAWSYSFPFADKGDGATFTATRLMRQRATSRTKPVLMTARTFNLGRAFLVSVSDSRDVGQGLSEWEETWASLPKTRREYGSIAYTLQSLLTTFSSEGNSYLLNEFTSTRDSAIVYEYSLNQPLPRIIAPFVLLQDSQHVYIFGGWGTFNPGQEILAQDTQSEIYMCRIYCRKSVLISYGDFKLL